MLLASVKEAEKGKTEGLRVKEYSGGISVRQFNGRSNGGLGDLKKREIGKETEKDRFPYQGEKVRVRWGTTKNPYRGKKKSINKFII